MVDPAELESATFRVSSERSNQLSYGSKVYYASGGVDGYRAYEIPVAYRWQHLPVSPNCRFNSDPLATQNCDIEQAKSSQILLKTPAKSTTVLPCQSRVLPTTYDDSDPQGVDYSGAICAGYPQKFKPETSQNRSETA